LESPVEWTHLCLFQSHLRSQMYLTKSTVPHRRRRPGLLRNNISIHLSYDISVHLSYDISVHLSYDVSVHLSYASPHGGPAVATQITTRVRWFSQGIPAGILRLVQRLFSIRILSERLALRKQGMLGFLNPQSCRSSPPTSEMEQPIVYPAASATGHNAAVMQDGLFCTCTCPSPALNQYKIRAMCIPLIGLFVWMRFKHYHVQRGCEPECGTTVFCWEPGTNPRGKGGQCHSLIVIPSDPRSGTLPTCD